MTGKPLEDSRGVGPDRRRDAGQERFILAAWKAGLKPVATVRVFRLSRSAVPHAIIDAQRRWRRMER